MALFPSVLTTSLAPSGSDHQLDEVMADAAIKPDPETAARSPGVYADDALYEDTQDELEFTTNPNMLGAMLARIPRELWDVWSNLPDDAEVRVGTIRVADEADDGGNMRV